MKYFLIFFVILLVACSTGQHKSVVEKKYDDMLVGSWYGESPAEGGIYKKWVHIKNQDGTYETTFFVYDEFGEFIGSGKVAGAWWVIGELLYQFEESWMTVPLKYKYVLTEKQCIQYSMVSGDIGDDVPSDYTFLECRHKN
jgi:hypothetical protein